MNFKHLTALKAVIDAEGFSAAAESLSITQSSLTKMIAQLCLLYTSPSPRDLSTSRMPSSA